jgi:hypothetical protein
MDSIWGAWESVRETVGGAVSAVGGWLSGAGNWIGDQLESAGNWFSKDKYGDRWNWENNDERSTRYELQDRVNRFRNNGGLSYAGDDPGTIAYMDVMLNATLARRMATSLGVRLNGTDSLAAMPDDFVDSFLRRELSPNGTNSPFHAKAQAILNYSDGRGGADRFTMVSGVKYNLNEISGTNLQAIATVDSQLWLNTAVAANQNDITQISIASMYRPGNASHDARAMDISGVTYTAIGPDGNSVTRTAAYNRVYHGGENPYYDNATPTQKLLDFENSFMALNDSRAVITPWRTAYNANGETASRVSLVDTYAWIGDRAKFGADWQSMATDNFIWSTISAKANWIAILRQSNGEAILRQLSLDRQHVDHGHFSVGAGQSW